MEMATLVPDASFSGSINAGQTLRYLQFCFTIKKNVIYFVLMNLKFTRFIH